MYFVDLQSIMEYVPNEILCQLLSYITDANDIIRLRQVNTLFRELSRECIRQINSKYIRVELLLQLPALTMIKGTVLFNDTLDLELLSATHPSSTGLKIMHLSHKSRFEALINQGFTPISQYPIKVTGISDGMLHVQSQHGPNGMTVNTTLPIRGRGRRRNTRKS